MLLAFGDYRLDFERRELRRGSEMVSLEPKAFDLLAYLVRHRDRVVSKDDLLQEVWGGRIVSEAALTTRINAVRRAVGDDGTAQRLVRTLTRKGIRFIGDVTELPDPATPAAIRLTDPVRPLDKPSIAVLPFQNLSGDPEQEYFADGMVEEIITALSRIRSLFVIARNSSFTYKGQAVDVKKLGANWVCATCSEARCASAANGCVLPRDWLRPKAARICGPTTSTARSKTCSTCRTEWRAASPGSSSRHCMPPK